MWIQDGAKQTDDRLSGSLHDGRQTVPGKKNISDNATKKALKFIYFQNWLTFISQ